MMVNQRAKQQGAGAKGGRLKGAALSLFVKAVRSSPASTGVRTSYTLVLAGLAMLIVLQLIPRLEMLPNGIGWRVFEALCLLALNAVAAGICAFWFWIYFADRPAEMVWVRPHLMGDRQYVKLAVPEGHTAQLILLLLPLMLSALAALVALFIAQLGYLLGLLAEGGVASLLAVTAEECAGFGDVGQQAFLALFTLTLGGGQDCLKLSMQSGVAAQLSLWILLVRSMLAAVALTVFMQFGSALLVKR